ncbi:MAG: TIGR00296 family protein [Candidatus Diapherotrites archaeon]|nr:TIGR00296 family protein [Candidatus Diapherotrites archaeon]
MEGKFTARDAKEFIRLARKAIEYYNLTGVRYSEGAPKQKYRERRGVFVTLHSYPSGELRGCIGIPYPEMELWNAIIEAAIGASRDPRFRPLSNDELEKCTVEISVLTKPERIEKKDILKKIIVGKHGLIVKRGFNSGLLLPQVATEYKWDSETFLEQTCVKAGLPREAWKLRGTEIYTFSAQVFKEEKPHGAVREVKLT